DRPPDPLRALSPLREGPLRHLGGPLVGGPFRDTPQLLVPADLEVLERVRERGELAGRVGMALEERAPVERAEAERCVLQRGRIAAERVQTLLQELRMVARLGEMLGIDRSELRVARQLRAAFEQLDRLRLD